MSTAATSSSASLTTCVTATEFLTAPAHLTLKLRTARRRRVRFAEDVVDNEDLGRKKSKCCCQYHRPKAFDESSDEEGDAGPCDRPCSPAQAEPEGGGSDGSG
uniref:Protein phosphatase 1 regulatory subunit 11 n=1 Tax=Emiliania huxleyi TaxID=2903 RepID=A0A6V2LVF3_EMIHU|mmetsp:Transcript_48602/g.156466  ORF Transcript_48602/g.156466 Transcript_48602/m.156466 type:complete len:103 (-) Transcript_48602:89-397(-)